MWLIDRLGTRRALEARAKAAECEALQHDADGEPEAMREAIAARDAYADAVQLIYDSEEIEANESNAALAYAINPNMGTEIHDADRARFVKNLGWLLMQTSNGIESCEWRADDDTVIIHYHGAHTREVNVHMDSYLAIIRDVTRSV